jgi:hypothetical protein
MATPTKNINIPTQPRGLKFKNKLSFIDYKSKKNTKGWYISKN